MKARFHKGDLLVSVSKGTPCLVVGIQGDLVTLSRPGASPVTTTKAVIGEMLDKGLLRVTPRLGGRRCTQ